MWILVHNIFVDPQLPIWQPWICGVFSTFRFGVLWTTKMLCTKIHIYNQFPVDTNHNQCRIGIKNVIYLSSKNFHLAIVVNLLAKFQIKLGTPKPWSISFFWSDSINTWNLAPESASGAKHFRFGVILGHPSLQWEEMENFLYSKNWGKLILKNFPFWKILPISYQSSAISILVLVEK